MAQGSLGFLSVGIVSVWSAGFSSHRTGFTNFRRRVHLEKEPRLRS